MIETGQAIAEFEAGLALDTQSKVRKNGSFSTFLVKTTALPRQARDKHRFNSETSTMVLSRS